MSRFKGEEMTPVPARRTSASGGGIVAVQVQPGLFYTPTQTETIRNRKTHEKKKKVTVEELVAQHPKQVQEVEDKAKEALNFIVSRQHHILANSYCMPELLEAEENHGPAGSARDILQKFCEDDEMPTRQGIGQIKDLVELAIQTWPEEKRNASHYGQMLECSSAAGRAGALLSLHALLKYCSIGMFLGQIEYLKHPPNKKTNGNGKPPKYVPDIMKSLGKTIRWAQKTIAAGGEHPNFNYVLELEKRTNGQIVVDVSLTDSHLETWDKNCKEYNTNYFTNRLKFQMISRLHDRNINIDEVKVTAGSRMEGFGWDPKIVIVYREIGMNGAGLNASRNGAASSK